MATSVKIDERTKDRLEQLQAAIKLETGEKVTQQALLDRIVAREFDSREALIASFRGDWDGLTAEETDRWLSAAGAWDGDGEPDHDSALYGRDMAAKKLGEDPDP